MGVIRVRRGGVGSLKCEVGRYVGVLGDQRRVIVYPVRFFFSSRRRHTRLQGDWSSDVCSSDLFSMRLEARAARAYKESVTATHLAEAALAQAMREIAADSAWVALAEDGELTFYTRYRIALPRLPRVHVPFGPGHFSYRLSDEEGRLNLNTSHDRMDRLLRFLGLDKSTR